VCFLPVAHRGCRFGTLKVEEGIPIAKRHAHGCDGFHTLGDMTHRDAINPLEGSLPPLGSADWPVLASGFPTGQCCLDR
jgi:hypothetical protein